MKKRNNFYLFCRFLLFVLLKLFFRFKVTGRKNVPRRGGCIIASNHLSYLDPVVLSVACPRILSFMSKQELFENKFFSLLIRALNAFPLQRGKTDLKAIRASIEKLKENQTLIIFPEGTRSQTGKINQAQPGVSMLAAKAKVPVVPTLIIGTDKAMPAKSKRISLFSTIEVHFSKPIVFDPKNSDADTKSKYYKFSSDIINEIKRIKKNKNSL